MRHDLLGLELSMAQAMLQSEGIDPEITVTRAPRRQDDAGCTMRVVYAGDDVIFSKKRPVLAPGEMETVILKAKVLKQYADLDHITVTLEEA